MCGWRCVAGVDETPCNPHVPLHVWIVWIHNAVDGVTSDDELQPSMPQVNVLGMLRPPVPVALSPTVNAVQPGTSVTLLGDSLS